MEHFEVLKEADGSLVAYFPYIKDKRRIYENNAKQKYFSVPNDKHPLKLFTNRIKDAYDAVREGNGHSIYYTHSVFGSWQVEVRFFLDEGYGEKQRKECLKQFENARFGYSLKFGYLNSFSQSQYISENFDRTLVYSEKNPHLFRDTEEEVIKIRDDILAEAKKYAVRVGKEPFDQLDAYLKENTNSLVRELAYAIFDDVKYQFDIIQTIHPSFYQSRKKVGRWRCLSF